MPTSRERVREALSHRTPDSVPLDIGASAVTGMHASMVYKLRQALKLDDPSTTNKNRPVRLSDIFFYSLISIRYHIIIKTFNQRISKFLTIKLKMQRRNVY